MGIWKDIVAGMRTSPVHGVRLWLPVFVLYGVAVVVIGFLGGMLSFRPLDVVRFWYLPVTLFVFPALLEELFFRGVLVPRDLLAYPVNRQVKILVMDAAVFVLWHPINALTINPTARGVFLDPVFLLIVFVLGLVAGVGYAASRSIWVPVIMHWLTVIVWVMLLGGRNLVLEV